MLHHCFTQPTKWTKKINGLADMWASRSKPKKALYLHPTAGILLQSLVFFPPALPEPPAPAFGVQRRCFVLLSETCYVLSLRWFSLNRKGWCSNTSVSISLSFWEPRYQSSRRLLKSPTHLHKQTRNHNQHNKGVVNPFTATCESEIW